MHGVTTATCACHAWLLGELVALLGILEVVTLALSGIVALRDNVAATSPRLLIDHVVDRR